MGKSGGYTGRATPTRTTRAQGNLANRHRAGSHDGPRGAGRKATHPATHPQAATAAPLTAEELAKNGFKPH